jgi:hypothetical protein
LFSASPAATTAATSAALVRGTIVLIVVGVARRVVVVYLVVVVLVHVVDVIGHHDCARRDECDGLGCDEQRHVGRWCGVGWQWFRHRRRLGLDFESLRRRRGAVGTRLDEDAGGVKAQLSRRILVSLGLSG